MTTPILASERDQRRRLIRSAIDRAFRVELLPYQPMRRPALDPDVDAKVLALFPDAEVIER